MPTLFDAGGQTQAWVTVGPKSRLPSRAPPSHLQSLSAGAGVGHGNSRRYSRTLYFKRWISTTLHLTVITIKYLIRKKNALWKRCLLAGNMQTNVFHWLVIGSTFDLSLQEPVGPPTPKRPRGRPKGSKNKGPRTALKVETDQSVQDVNYLIELWLQNCDRPCFCT